MATWDGCIDTLIARSKDASGQAHADKACLIGLDGGAKWTTDQHPCAFKLTPDEAASIAKCFKTNDFSDFRSSGVHAEGKSYLFLGEDDGKVQAKRKNSGVVTLQASYTAVVIGHTAEGMQPESTSRAVSFMVEYLKNSAM